MNSLSPMINFIISRGVPLETVIMLLMLPLIATFIAFLRQVIGIKAFGIYTPLLITFAFLATNGIKYGVAIFVVVILAGMLMRFVLKPFRLLYLPRVALMLTAVAFLIMAMLVIGGSFKRTGLAAVSIFPILIMISLVEKFVAVQIEKGDKTAIILTLETLLISVAGYYIASWELLRDALSSFPAIILLTIPINIILGKWTGLRISEYIRFKDVLKKM